MKLKEFLDRLVDSDDQVSELVALMDFELTFSSPGDRKYDVDCMWEIDYRKARIEFRLCSR
jgi:hypothetical protein